MDQSEVIALRAVVTRLSGKVQHGGLLGNVLVDVADVAEVLRALPDRAWQGMETAPKFAKMLFVVATRKDASAPETMFAYWNGQQSCWCRLYGHEIESIEPTHWMPLPDPPVDLAPALAEER